MEFVLASRNGYGDGGVRKRNIFIALVLGGRGLPPPPPSPLGRVAYMNDFSLRRYVI